MGAWLSNRICENCESRLILWVNSIPHCFVCESHLRKNPLHGHVSRLLPRINYELPERGGANIPQVVTVDGYCYYADSIRWMIDPVEDTVSTRSTRGINT